MDNGFPILDAFNDDQAFERHFGSLLDDASTQLPVSVSVTDEVVSPRAVNQWRISGVVRLWNIREEIMELFERSAQLRPGIGGSQQRDEGIYISVRNLLKKDRTETSHSTETAHNSPHQTPRLEWCWVCDILPL